MLHWNVSPEIIALGPLHLRWYGLLFATAFYIGYRRTQKIFIFEKINPLWADSLLFYLGIGTLAGARLGHTLLYEPDIYLRDPLRILMIWEGGLASHGAVIGVLVAVYLFCRKHKPLTMLWVLDRLSASFILGGAMVRLGNLFNSEIIGKPTNVPWAIIFDRIDPLPRHPSQVYESLSYFVIFFILNHLYWKTDARNRRGLIFGGYLVGVFIVRFLIEFLKAEQVAFERGMALNMGQLLSVPMILAGAFLIFRALTKPRIDPKRS